ncbi:MAG: glycosyltransferase [Patescibacteria group bacterium]
MLSRDAAGLDPEGAVVKRWRALATAGCELSVIVASREVGGFSDGRLTVTGTGGRTAFGRLKRMRALLRSASGDLITAQDPFELGWIASRAARRKKIPFEIQDHGGFFDGQRSVEPLWFVRKILARHLARHADFIRTVSPGSFEALQRMGFGNKTLFLPIPVEQRFADAKRNREPGLIVSVGRLATVKRMDLVVRAFAIVYAQKPASRLAIVGDGPERSRLEALAKSLGINSLVTFVGAADPLPWLERADVFVLASAHEGWGVAAVEAALVGVPVIMTDTGCARELARSDAATISAAEPSALAAALLGHMGTTPARQPFPASWVDLGQQMRTYAAWWKKATRRAIMVCVQAVDQTDPYMGYFVSWLEKAAESFSKIDVLALRVGTYSLPPNVQVFPLRRTGSRSRLAVVWNLWRLSWNRRRNYSGVFVRGDAQYVVLAGWLWRALGKRVVLWYAHFQPNRYLDTACRIAQTTVTSVPEAFGSRACEAIPIGQGIDGQRFPANTGLRSLPYRVLVFGRVSEAKKIVELVRDFRTSATAEALHLFIVGRPLKEDYGAAVRSEVVQTEGCTWIEEDVPFEHVPSLMASYDILCSSTSASLDKVILEGIFSGLLPIAATGAAVGLLPADLGWLHAPDSVSRIAAFQRVAQLSPPDLADCARRIRELVLEKHSIDSQLGRLYSLFV